MVGFECEKNGVEKFSGEKREVHEKDSIVTELYKFFAGDESCGSSS